MATNPEKQQIDWDAVKNFMAKPAPGNEARTIAEYAAILAYWNECEPQIGMPRGILLDDTVIQEIPPMHKIVLGAVQVNTHKDAGHIYSLGSGTFGLGAPVYLAVASAAGISFPDETSGVDMVASQFPDRVVAKVGSLRTDLAGQTQYKTGVYVLDIDNKCAKEEAKGDVSDSKLLAFRQNLRESSVQRAITGAQRAAVKAHYGKLRRKWYEEDFQVPLLVPRLVTDMKAVLETPEGRTMFAMASTGLAKLAFGGGRSPLAGLFGTSAPAPVCQIAAPIGETLIDDDDDTFPEATRAPVQPDPVNPGADPAAHATANTQPPAGTKTPEVKPDKAHEWRAIFAAAKEAGFTAAQKDDVQARARSIVAALGGNPDSSDTWTFGHWNAVRDSFKSAEKPTGAARPIEFPTPERFDTTADKGMRVETLAAVIAACPNAPRKPDKALNQYSDGALIKWYAHFYGMLPTQAVAQEDLP